MVGPPGAGKSTYARKLAKETGAVVIETDEIRKQAGPLWTELEDGIVEMIEENIPNDIILDAPHCSRFERKLSTDLLMMHGYDVVAVVIKTPLEECLLRNATRSKNVPRHAITRWENTLERELSTIPSEPFKKVITVQ